MKIQIFGMGCTKCKQIHEDVKKAVSESKLVAQIEYITDMKSLMENGVLQTPTIRIDGKTVISGSVPDYKKIKTLLSK